MPQLLEQLRIQPAQQVASHRLAKPSGPGSVSRSVSGLGPGPESASGPGQGPRPSVVSGCEGVSAAHSRDTAIPDGAAWAPSGFAFIPRLEVVVRLLGVGSLGAKNVTPGLIPGVSSLVLVFFGVRGAKTFHS